MLRQAKRLQPEMAEVALQRITTADAVKKPMISKSVAISVLIIF
jgi:hypothetical protein